MRADFVRFAFDLKRGPSGNLLHGSAGNLVKTCGGGCPCNSPMACHFCSPPIAGQFHVTFTGVGLCTTCVNCPAAGLSFNVTGGSSLNGTYILTRNGECAWTRFAVDVPCSASGYPSTDCTGTATPYTFAIQQVRISATQFQLQVISDATPILLFNAVIDVASCCAGYTTAECAAGLRMHGWRRWNSDDCIGVWRDCDGDTMLNENSPNNELSPAALGHNLSTCHRCPRRQSECAGACACIEDGQDLIEHATRGICPLHRFPNLPPRGLGDVVANVAARVGANKIADAIQQITGRDCGCRRRQELLNRLVPFQSRENDSI